VWPISKKRQMLERLDFMSKGSVVQDKETVLVDVPLDERGLSHGTCKPCVKTWLEKREAA